MPLKPVADITWLRPIIGAPLTLSLLAPRFGPSLFAKTWPHYAVRRVILSVRVIASAREANVDDDPNWQHGTFFNCSRAPDRTHTWFLDQTKKMVPSKSPSERRTHLASGRICSCSRNEYILATASKMLERADLLTVARARVRSMLVSAIYPKIQNQNEANCLKFNHGLTVRRK